MHNHGFSLTRPHQVHAEYKMHTYGTIYMLVQHGVWCQAYPRNTDATCTVLWQTFPIFHSSSTSVYYHEHKQKIKTGEARLKQALIWSLYLLHGVSYQVVEGCLTFRIEQNSINFDPTNFVIAGMLPWKCLFIINYYTIYLLLGLFSYISLVSYTM